MSVACDLPPTLPLDAAWLSICGVRGEGEYRSAYRQYCCPYNACTRENCSARADPRSQLQSITVSPDPPVPGKNLTVNVEATVQDKIEVGPSCRRKVHEYSH